MYIKRTALILIGLLLHVSSGAQGRKTFDTDFGLGKFKLESPISLYSRDITHEWTDEQGVEWYKYKGAAIEYLGFKITEVDLLFFNNKLYSVQFTFGILSSTKALELFNKMMARYDPPRIVDVRSTNPEAGIISAAIWETGIAYLQLDEYSCSHGYQPCQTVAFLCSKKLEKLIKAN